MSQKTPSFQTKTKSQTCSETANSVIFNIEETEMTPRLETESLYSPNGKTRNNTSDEIN